MYWRPPYRYIRLGSSGTDPSGFLRVVIIKGLIVVLVCRPKEFIFLKTRKTAGTSVEMLLEPLCAEAGHVPVEYAPTKISRYGVIAGRPMPKPSRMAAMLDVIRGPRWIEHMPAADVRRRLGAGTFDSYCKLTTVRNPFDRMVSQFHWRSRKRDGVAPEDLRSAFKAHLNGSFRDDVEIVQIDGRMIPDRVIRFEHLNEDLTELATAWDLPIVLSKLPHKKNLGAKRKGTPLEVYYDAEAIDIVRRRMAWVFDLGIYPDLPDFDTAA